MDPRPTYEFYIPSVYDDTALACRIYSLSESYFGGGGQLVEHDGGKPWTPKGAIVAHPYTSLGGSYNDSTVLHVVGTLMRKGFTVGTFCFRGAGKSKGKSTWSSKAELQDYISFVGFFMYYLSSVYPPIPRSESIDDDGPPLTPVVSGVPATRPPAHLILAGYSYGALLTRYLPRIPALLGRFSKVLKTSTKAEIRLRAAKLASVTHIDILSRPLHGTEASGNARRSRGVQSSRPGDRTDRTSEDWALEKDSHMQYLQTPFVRDGKRDSWPDQHNGLDPDDDDYIARLDVPTPKTHYLLISLLLGPVAALCTGFGALGNAELDSKFMYNETLVLHGEKDRLTSLKRLSSWADALMPGRDRRFAVVKIENTGHFWRDKRAIEDLERTIKTWVRTYVKDESQSS